MIRNLLVGLFIFVSPALIYGTARLISAAIFESKYQAIKKYSANINLKNKQGD